MMLRVGKYRLNTNLIAYTSEDVDVNGRLVVYVTFLAMSNDQYMDFRFDGKEAQAILDHFDENEDVEPYIVPPR